MSLELDLKLQGACSLFFPQKFCLKIHLFLYDFSGDYQNFTSELTL